MSERVTQLLQQLTHTHSDSAHRFASQSNRITIGLQTKNLEELRLFWTGVQQLHDAQQLDCAGFNQWLHQGQLNLPAPTYAVLNSELVPSVAHLYRTWNDPGQPRHRLLILLLQQGGADGWRAFAELIATDPPVDAQQAVEVFLPIWRTENGPAQLLFPRLLDAVQHPSVAAIVLDLANYLARQGRLADHPARERADELTWLLGQLVERLEGYEQASRSGGVRDLDVARHVQETITMAVALSHTMAQLEHREAIGKLYRMLELQHRRLRVEAAAALAKLGEAIGVKTLVEMAAQPLVRLRAHAYAAELGVLDQIPGEFRSPEALAESELVIRLAEADLFGIPPLAWQLIDQRQLAWPGYEEPRACFLFRYTYRLGAGDYTNLALVGPVAHALTADLTDLALSDVYAVYAGWHVEHDELQRCDIDPADSAAADEIRRRVRALEQAGYTAIEPMFWGLFFGARLLVAAACARGEPGTVVAYEGQAEWFPQGNPLRPLGADLAYCLFVGRQLLRRFNPDWDEATAAGQEDADP